MLLIHKWVYQKDSRGYVGKPKRVLAREESTPPPESAPESDPLVGTPPSPSPPPPQPAESLFCTPPPGEDVVSSQDSELHLWPDQPTFTEPTIAPDATPTQPPAPATKPSSPRAPSPSKPAGAMLSESATPKEVRKSAKERAALLWPENPPATPRISTPLHGLSLDSSSFDSEPAFTSRDAITQPYVRARLTKKNTNLSSSQPSRHASPAPLRPSITTDMPPPAFVPSRASYQTSDSQLTSSKEHRLKSTGTVSPYLTTNASPSKQTSSGPSSTTISNERPKLSLPHRMSPPTNETPSKKRRVQEPLPRLQFQPKPEKKAARSPSVTQNTDLTSSHQPPPPSPRYRGFTPSPHSSDDEYEADWLSSDDESEGYNADNGAYEKEDESQSQVVPADQNITKDETKPGDDVISGGTKPDDEAIPADAVNTHDANPASEAKAKEEVNPEEKIKGDVYIKQEDTSTPNPNPSTSLKPSSHTEIIILDATSDEDSPPASTSVPASNRNISNPSHRAGPGHNPEDNRVSVTNSRKASVAASGSRSHLSANKPSRSATATASALSKSTSASASRPARPRTRDPTDDLVENTQRELERKQELIQRLRAARDRKIKGGSSVPNTVPEERLQREFLGGDIEKGKEGKK
ncbi:hypothetical protein K491DRAFT_698435 [Lophiostoma macrostomum CBS 122681]|uniref:Uncharacterized protein n=1 Tax=Lophiostoma macrostomum CBS 122681 TaxID=1314788 RepID=A0A6A6SMT6_9PLEO|nr:hypothetical protein K491DRAFT_698435 [Lophiostoma macrostomum CBS 122681]